jgi:hypothetical protein
MKTLQILTASAGILLALASPTLAASRPHSGAADAYASGATNDRSGSYYYGPENAQGRPVYVPNEARAQYGTSYGVSHGQNDMSTDRPYGNPDNW